MFGEELDQKYKEIRRNVENLLKDPNRTDDDLARQLESIHQYGRQSGIYSPVIGPNATEFLDIAKQEYLNMGYDEQTATKRAEADLRGKGYLAVLRRARRHHESHIRYIFDKIYSREPLDEQTERERISELRQRCFYMGKPESIVLSHEFSDGNFLYHGTDVERAIAILYSGELLNWKGISEREQKS